MLIASARPTANDGACRARPRASSPSRPILLKRSTSGMIEGLDQPHGPLWVGGALVSHGPFGCVSASGRGLRHRCLQLGHRDAAEIAQPRDPVGDRRMGREQPAEERAFGPAMHSADTGEFLRAMLVSPASSRCKAWMRPIGLRVSFAEQTSARYSRWREIAICTRLRGERRHDEQDCEQHDHDDQRQCDPDAAGAAFIASRPRAAVAAIAISAPAAHRPIIARHCRGNAPTAR